MLSVCAFLPIFELRIQGFFSILRHTHAFMNKSCIRPCGQMDRMLDFEASDSGSILGGGEVFLSFHFCVIYLNAISLGVIGIWTLDVGLRFQVALDSYLTITINEYFC